jgi:hypothetical protein
MSVHFSQTFMTRLLKKERRIFATRQIVSSRETVKTQVVSIKEIPYIR